MAAADDQSGAGEQPALRVESVKQAPSRKFSPATIELLRDLTPEQRDQAIAITARLLALKARRRAATRDLPPTSG